MADGGLLKALKSGKRLVLPGAYNAFAAKQIALAGFPAVYVSGAGLSNSLGVPDDGSLGVEDFLYLGGWIVKAAGVPVLCDADTGFQNVGGTVRRYIEAGISGLHIEDQVFPKRCGHLAGKEVVPADEMAGRIRDAALARDRHGPEFLVVARTDARGASNIAEGVQFEEAVARGRLYREAGAGAIFPEALRSREEFARYRKEVPGYLLANMTEFGQTPFIAAREFMEMGYDMVLFPVSLFRYHAGQTRAFLSRLHEDGTQEGLVPGMMSRAEINRLLDYNP